VSGGRGHLFPRPFHMSTPWVWKNVLICWDIYLAFYPVLTGWCNVSVCGNNLGIQVTRPLLFSAAYEGVQNCMLCWS